MELSAALLNSLPEIHPTNRQIGIKKRGAHTGEEYEALKYPLSIHLKNIQ